MEGGPLGQHLSDTFCFAGSFGAACFHDVEISRQAELFERKLGAVGPFASDQGDVYLFLAEKVQELADIGERVGAHIVQVLIEAEITCDAFFIMLRHEGHDGAFFGRAEGGNDLCIGQRL